ncbi:MAG: Lrp/AsnC family transcriptional regulator [archaeon]
MDNIDRKIVRILQENSKTQYHKISDKLKLAPSTIHFRIKKMLKEGIIERFSAVLNPEKAGYPSTAWIGLSADPRKMDAVAKKLARFDEVQLVCTATGDHDLLIQVIARNEKDLWRFINKRIKTMAGLNKGYDVSTFLDVYKRTSIIKL